jgi:hypothetical protein
MVRTPNARHYPGPRDAAIERQSYLTDEDIPLSFDPPAVAHTKVSAVFDGGGLSPTAA